MNRQQEHEKIRQECMAYFHQNAVWKRMFTAFLDKYRSYGRFAGKVVLKNLSQEEIEELEGFFGQNFHGQKSVTVSAEKLKKALLNSRYQAVMPEEILMEFSGKPLLGKAEEKARTERKLKEIREEFEREFAETPAAECPELLESLLKGSDPDERKRLLWSCAEIYNALPYRTQQRMYLAVFAAEMTGNPHAFDPGSAEGKLLYQVVQTDLVKRNQAVEESGLFPAYKRQKSLLLCGILIDDISNYALLSQVHAVKWDGSWHKGMEGFYQENSIVQVPLHTIAEWERIACVDQEIYIVENPSVFAMICGERSCMCMNGQPKLAGLMVLELLAKSGTKVYYSGDLDPEGLLIAQKLSLFYNGDFEYWHMSESDYMACRSGEILSDRRIKMLEKITDERLIPAARAIRAHKTAGYQEKIGYSASNEEWKRKRTR